MNNIKVQYFLISSSNFIYIFFFSHLPPFFPSPSLLSPLTLPSSQVITMNPAKVPESLKDLGLKHLPALIHEDEGFDTVDDIIQYLDNE